MKKDINLLKGCMNHQEYKDFRRKIIMMIYPSILVGISALLIVIFGASSLVKYGIYMSNENFVKNKDSQNIVLKYDNISRNVDELKDIFETQKSDWESDGGNFYLNDFLIREIIMSFSDTVSVTGLTFDEKNQILRIDVKSIAESSIYDAVKSIKELNVFKNVNYYGYMVEEKKGDEEDKVTKEIIFNPITGLYEEKEIITEYQNKREAGYEYTRGYIECNGRVRNNG